ncbi:MAG: aldo/keto reductase [Candidatus Dormibacteria bacterium]
MVPTMLGRSGLSASPIGLGLAAIGRPAYINLGRQLDLGPDRQPGALRRQAHRLLDLAYSLGVRYFDAARSYGRAEQFLGSWLQERGPLPEPVTCGSKWGYSYVGDWRMDAPVHELKDHSLAALSRQYLESRELLGDHLNLYQIHSATLESGVLQDVAVLRELLRIGRSGLAIGLSVSGPRQAEVIRQALAVEVDGLNPFACVQATWNLLEQSAAPALEAAHRAGWGVLIKEAMANGRLLERGDRRLVPLEAVARSKELPWDQVVLAATLAQPFADVVLSGAVTAAQVQSNATAATVRLSPQELEPLQAMSRPAEEYWQERRRLPWS